MTDYFFDYLFPLAIEIGMTSEEFWKDDPKLFSSYYKAYIEKKKREMEELNYSNWLEGLYVYNGLQCSLKTFGYGFLIGKENPDKKGYPEKPFDLFGKEKNKEVIERKKVQKQNQQNLNYWARIKR